MSLVVCVHGIAQEFKGRETVFSMWVGPLRDGIEIAKQRGFAAVGTDRLKDEDVAVAFFGDLFRQEGTMMVGAAPFEASDVTDDEAELLDAWWREAARMDPEVVGPEAVGAMFVRTPESVQRALDALSRSRFFEALFGEGGDRAFISSLKQVGRYFREPEIRRAVQARAERLIGPDTRVVVGHSLGSVVAYECLCAHPEWSVNTFVTLGSPMGIRRVVFDRLQPTPLESVGFWPGSVRRWVNVADAGDPVALVKDLDPWFSGKVEDRRVHNGWRSHLVVNYLTAHQTGEAVAHGL
jgi:hypothetical protein